MSAIRWPLRAVGVDQLDDARVLVDLALVAEVAVDQPAHRLVRDPQRGEDLVVELVGEQQLVDRGAGTRRTARPG